MSCFCNECVCMGVGWAHGHVMGKGMEQRELVLWDGAKHLNRSGKGQKAQDVRVGGHVASVGQHGTPEDGHLPLHTPMPSMPQSPTKFLY